MAERAKSELDSKVAAVRDLLSRALQKHRRLVYSNSLGAEAVVLTDIIAAHTPTIDIFTLDTGRLHEETYDLLSRLQHRYEDRIRVVYPDREALEQLVTRQGVNGFYDGIDARLECCRIRKVEPFKRAIVGFPAWITGVRRRHSADRAKAQPLEWDSVHGLYKVSPLLDWTDEDVWGYIRAHRLPYNRLHDRGFPSIGCAPCTRAIQAGEDFRAGRWWWEKSASRECGLLPRRSPSIPIVVVPT